MKNLKEGLWSGMVAISKEIVILMMICLLFPSYSVFNVGIVTPELSWRFAVVAFQYAQLMAIIVTYVAMSIVAIELLRRKFMKK